MVYIFTGNDVINYFLSAANRINVFNLCHVRIVIDFSITVRPILKKFTVLETVVQGLHFGLRNSLDMFAP